MRRHLDILRINCHQIYPVQHCQTTAIKFLKYVELGNRKMPSFGVLSRVALVRTVTANVVPLSPILVTLMMEVLSFSATSVLTSATRRNFPDDGNLHSHRRENFKSYNQRNHPRITRCVYRIKC
jgi:hypothetical protein